MFTGSISLPGKTTSDPCTGTVSRRQRSKTKVVVICCSRDIGRPAHKKRRESAVDADFLVQGQRLSPIISIRMTTVEDGDDDDHVCLYAIKCRGAVSAYHPKKTRTNPVKFTPSPACTHARM